MLFGNIPNRPTLLGIHPHMPTVVVGICHALLAELSASSLSLGCAQSPSYC